MRIVRNQKLRMVVLAAFFGSCPLCGNAGVVGVRAHQMADNSFVRYVEEGDTLALTDEQFLDMAGQVIFPVNETRLPEGDPLLVRLDREILPALNREGSELVGIMIRGSASPEGPLSVNKRLGTQRAAALVDFVKSRLTVPFSDSNCKIDIDFEDYRTLCIFLSRAHDKHFAQVKELCDHYLPTGDVISLKRELQLAQDGMLWQHLLKNYFPDLRAARIVLVFRKAEPEVVPEVNVVEVEPESEVEPMHRVEVVPRREFLSVKTNLLFDFAYVPGYDRWCPIPNIAVEYYPRKGHFTFGASFDCPWWQDYAAHKYFQVRNYQLETRYYLKPGDEVLHPAGKGAAFKGLYFQGYAHLGVFGVCFDADRGWVGEGIGAGVGIGYVLPLSKKGHWRLEFGAQFGVYTCKYDPYQYENPVDENYRDNRYYYKWTEDPELFKKRQYRYTWVGPTRIGITLCYDLFYRRVSKRGISLKNKEEIMYE